MKLIFDVNHVNFYAFYYTIVDFPPANDKGGKTVYIPTVYRILGQNINFTLKQVYANFHFKFSLNL